MSGKSTTISQLQPAAGNLRIQTSVLGSAIQMVYGTTRISGNLAWFGGFQAVPHTSTTSSGGKGGGGVKTSTTTYTYVAAVLMLLCEGPINGVLSAWKGKLRYWGLAAGASAVQHTETAAIPSAGGTYQVQSGGTAFLNNVGVFNEVPDNYDNGLPGG